MSMILKRSRIRYLDIAKGIAMLSVVIGHTASPLRNFVYLYHLPVFFFVSGYFWKSKPVFREHLMSRLRGLYVPYVAFGLFFILFNVLFAHFGFTSSYGGVMGGVKQFVKVLQFGGTSSEKLFDPFWFLKSLFIMDIAFFFVSKFARNVNAIALFSLISALVGWIGCLPFLHIAALNSVLIIPSIAMPFFALGFAFKGRKLIGGSAASLLAISLMILLSFFVSIDLAQIHIPFLYYYPISFLGVYGVMTAAQWLDEKGGIFAVFFSYLGRKTIPVLALHKLAFCVFVFVALLLGGVSGNLQKHLYGFAWWWAPVTMCGIVLPLLIDFSARKIWQSLNE